MSGIEARFRLDRPGFALDVDLRLPGSGVTALFGPSGSGKTTLLRCIAGLERPARGRLVVAGEVWQDEGVKQSGALPWSGLRRRPPEAAAWLPAHRRPVGYVFQEAGLFAHLSVIGNLRYGRKRSKERWQVGLEQAIDLLGIGHLLDRRPDRLSGGERQRVAIARALAVNPRLLLMDEPLSSLDLERKREILPFLERLHDELRIPVLYVSHAPDEVARLADYLVVLDGGRALASGPLGEMLTRIELPVRLGADAAAILEGTVGEVDHHWYLARVDFDGGTLWAREQGLLVGSRVRVRVLARDVSLAADPGTSSIQNVLRGTVDAIGADEHPGLVLVRVRVGASVLLARLTRRSAAALDVVPGRELWVQVKSVALLE